MSDETQQIEETEKTETPAAVAEAPAKAAAPIEEQAEEKKDVEMTMCMVSKQMVPLEETIELERKKGEVLRIHSRYKKFN
ncbi:MAG: hypothetical protein P1V51_11860 [Deltaproteobacteria bacterium]|nr:hypothetical protein [Deltaproteobacteria bacterium]